jgi:hypothetical protein
MQYLPDMERPESPNNLDEHIPNLLLLDIGFPFLVVANLLIQITVICKLHHETQALAALIYEGLFVADHVWFIDRC